jgi:hypothetical protein
LGCDGAAARPTGLLVTASIGTFALTLRSDPASILSDACCSASALACCQPPPLVPCPPLPLLGPLPAEPRSLKPLALCLLSLALLLPPSCPASASSVPPAVAVVVPATAPVHSPVLSVTLRATGPLVLLPLLCPPALSLLATSPLFPCKIPPLLPLQSVLAFGGSFPFSSGRRGVLLLGRCFLAILLLSRPSALTSFPFS